MIRGNIEMILRWVIGIIVIYLLYRLIRKSFPAVGGKAGSARIQTPAAGEELVEDPLCHTYVPLSQALRTEIDGKTVYFCSQKCLEQYRKK
jgi:YHS domain-containing protein